MRVLDLARLRYEIASALLVLEAWKLHRHTRKYSPDQPRVPAGSRDGGQRTDWHHGPKQAGPFNEINRSMCEAQYDSDMFLPALDRHVTIRQHRGLRAA
jgi:hypothetical protein